MRAVIYARFSSQMQRDASIEDQERLCRERAKREGWEITTTFADRALSGASMLRPGLQALLEAASEGQFEVLLTEALDRLSRDQADVATLYKRLSFDGIQIVTLSEGEISELHVGLKGTMNQLFLMDLANKTRRGLRGRVEAASPGAAIPSATMWCGERYRTGRLPPVSAPSIARKRRWCPGSLRITRRAFRRGRSPLVSIASMSPALAAGRGARLRSTAIRRAGPGS